METLVTVIHYVVCIFLIGVILLQAGKGADIGAAFGAGGSQTVFGARGPATFLNKLTIAAAAIFLITSITLAQFAKTEAGSSVVDTLPAQTAPQGGTDAAPETTEQRSVPQNNNGKTEQPATVPLEKDKTRK